MSDDRVRRLEEKLAYLERHVTEQDKAMLELADDLARVRLELRALRERNAGAPDSARGAGEMENERPPHY